MYSFNYIYVSQPHTKLKFLVGKNFFHNQLSNNFLKNKIKYNIFIYYQDK